MIECDLAKDSLPVVIFLLFLHMQELAHRLQEEEDLRIKRSEEQKKNAKMVVEMQDEELARYLRKRSTTCHIVCFYRAKIFSASCLAALRYLDDMTWKERGVADSYPCERLNAF